MEIKETTTLSPPHDAREYTLRIIDYGQGDNQLAVQADNDDQEYKFTISNQQLNECQWRSKDTLPSDILRAVEYYGYHVTDVSQYPKHGLYENVRYLRESIKEIETGIHEENYIGRSGIAWATESLDSLMKLELLRAHLTEAQFDIVMIKAQRTSENHPSGNLDLQSVKGKTSASLKSIVMLMLAYAQDEGFLEHQILDEDIVEKLIQEEPPYA